MNPLLEAIVSDPNALAAAVFGAVLGATALFAGLWYALFQGDERRLQRRIGRVVGGPGVASQPQEVFAGSLRKQTKDSSIASFDRLIKRALPRVKLMRQQLERSGLPLKVGDYLMICAGLGIAALLFMRFYFGFSLLLSALTGVVVGLGVPHLVVKRRIARRTRKFSTLLPEALDLIIRGIRSGLPATEAMNTIGTEIEDPVGTEFSLVSDQVRIGVSRDEALWSAARRLQIPEFNFLVISLGIQQETGGNLAEILEKLADMVRRREQMRLKIKAMSSEARASAMIIGSLPFIMAGVLSLINPGYMNVLFTDPRGWVMIGIGFVSLALGVGVMAKMVRFEI